MFMLFKLVYLENKILLVLLYFTVLFNFNCNNLGKIESPNAHEGYLDLSNWDFDLYPTIKLDG